MLKDLVILVTGGSRGIGRAVVEECLKQGAKVYFTYNASPEKAKQLVDSLKSGRVQALACDVRNKEQVQATIDAIVEKEERLDVLVNNAGIIRDGLTLALADQDWQDVIETNLGGVYSFCKAAAKQMFFQRKGCIINLSSIVGELGGFGQVNYAASKGAINALTKSLASEFASRGITVNAVAPGMVNTEMSSTVRELLGDKLKEKIPLGRYAEPEDVAALVAFLASKKARYITGQIITVDGGLSLLSRR